jgi:hypothetical protein
MGKHGNILVCAVSQPNRPLKFFMRVFTRDKARGNGELAVQ